MYKRVALALFCLMPVVAMASESTEFSGPDHCRVANLPGTAGAIVKWSGGCRDGYAEGKGTLEWHRKRKVAAPHEGKLRSGKENVLAYYEGDIRKGLLHGDGYLRLNSNGTQYEGQFADGRYNGRGALLHIMGRYEGDFVDGCTHGRGKMVFNSGGSYDGEWQCGQFHGNGTAVYSSGRTATSRWVNGIRADLVALLKADPKYVIPPSMRSAVSELGWDCEGIGGGSLPIGKPFSEMSDTEKMSVCAGFPLLDDGDEPPYPLDGLKDIHALLTTGLSRIKEESDGNVSISVEVDATGNPTKVSVYASPNKYIANYTTLALLKAKYKPGTCGGKPCTMSYRFCFVFTYD